MTVTQTIRVHGYPFQVVSDQRLTEDPTRLLVEAMEVYNPKQIKILFQGRKGEPPLRILYTNDRVLWSTFLSFFDSRSLVNNPNVRGLYLNSSNTLLLERQFSPEAKAVIQHEVAHVLDDFAVTRYKNFTMVEYGTASKDYASVFQKRPYSDQSAEDFADAILYMQLRGGDKNDDGILTIFPHFQSIKTFLANYPHIPGVALEEQYNTGVWLPILRIGLW